MKGISKLINHLGKTARMYQTNAQNKIEVKDISWETESAFNEGIAKGIELAINQLIALNDDLDRKFNEII